MVRRLEILGPPRVVDLTSGRPIQCWRSQMTLLARLALAPDGVPRQHLAALVWPETSANAARRSLRQALFQLRRHVGDLVVDCGDRLKLDPRVATDERQFHALLREGHGTEALDLYRGELLEGLDPPAGTPFEDWLFVERARLERLAARALRDVLEAAARAGEWAAGIRSAERWLAKGRCNESAYGFLMRAFAHAGDRARALAVYHELQSRLRQELDAAVDSSLEALADRLRHSAPVLDGRPAAGPGSIGVLCDPPFVGRNREFARLSDAWEAARAGHRRFLLVAGDAGGGKTRLVSEFARWVRLSDATALVGRSYELERTIPYATLTSLLREAIDAPGLSACDPPLLAELTCLVPELAQRFPAATGRTPARRSRAGRYRLHEATRAVFENLACEQPLLIIIDDLPWADEASLAAIHYAWRTLAAAPLLLVATARPDQVGPGTSVEPLLASLVREGEPAVGRIDLLPLDAPAVAELVRAIGADAAGDLDASGATLAHDTGGNPLFVIETLRASLAGSTPARSATLRALASDRMAGLSGPARDLLQAAAVLGRRFTLPVARAVAGLDARVAAVAACELVGRDLLRRSRYHYDFTHEILRQILYEDLSPELRAVLHEQTYRWYLSNAPAKTPGLDVTAALARHAGGADLRPAAYQWSVRSAELAERLYAGAEAEEYLRDALTFADSTAAARTVWRRLGDLWRAQAWFGKAAVAYLRALPPDAGDALGIRLRMLDAALRAELVTLPEVRPELRRLVDAAAREGPALQRDALLLAAEAVWRHADLDAALEYAHQAVKAARDAGEAGSLARALLLYARLRVRTTQSAGVLAGVEEAARVARDADLLLEWLQAEVECGLELYRLGRWKEAERIWRRALAQAEEESEFGSIAVISLNLGDLHLRRGAWQAAEKAFDGVERLCTRFDFPHVAAGLCTNRALLAWHRGDGPAAARHAQAAIAQASTHGLVAAERSARALYALTRLDAGDVGAADAEQRAIERLADRPHSTWADDGELAVIVRARLSQLQGNRQAAALLGRAASGARDRYARLLLEVERAALVQDSARRRAEAARLLPELRRLGVRPLIERAERLRDSLRICDATGFGPAARASRAGA
jgi:DNA-binding SARP family transcriptional activator/tetratricopeptide (TPR) repeat protein